MPTNPARRPRDTVIRLPRAAEMQPRTISDSPRRRPRRILTPPYVLLFGFICFIAVGSLLLTLPISDTQRQFTSPVTAIFTATSAVTVTGHTAVSTSQHWSLFGQAVIFLLMLVGGLGFMAAATFILVMLRQQTSLSHSLALRENLGNESLGGLREITRNIVVVVFIIYLAATLILLPWIQEMTGFGLGESLWQSLFLAVSSFNNAGFSILPEISDTRSLAILDNQWMVQAVMAVLIMVGGIGWFVLVDVWRKKRFVRFSLDTKLVLIGSLALWIIGFAAYFLAGYVSVGQQGDTSIGRQIGDSLFHSISGRTAGFIIADFGAAEDFTKLVFTFLMVIGGASGSVAGGIKVNTMMVVVAAVISSIRARPQTESFSREIPHTQVFRALAIGALALTFIMITVPLLTITEAASLRSGELQFLDLFFDTVSAYATNGSSTGVVPQLGTAGQLIFIVAMLIGRIGPLTLALALAPQERFVYRFAQERVRIG